jgi:hypothetical protein
MPAETPGKENHTAKPQPTYSNAVEKEDRKKERDTQKIIARTPVRPYFRSDVEYPMNIMLCRRSVPSSLVKAHNKPSLFNDQLR